MQEFISSNHDFEVSFINHFGEDSPTMNKNLLISYGRLICYKELRDVSIRCGGGRGVTFDLGESTYIVLEEDEAKKLAEYLGIKIIVEK